jgi:hypothetical protein
MKLCSTDGCTSGPTMGAQCITHWYIVRGKTPPPHTPPSSEFLAIIHGKKLKKQAIETVERNADPIWKTNAKRAVMHLAQTRATFTADDVWRLLDERGEESPREPRAMGAIMTAAAKAGIVEASTQWVESVRPECHRRPVRIWESRITK